MVNFLYVYIMVKFYMYIYIMDKTYFLMTNKKGDFGCFIFTDYELYKKCWKEYDRLNWIDDIMLDP
jgi:hypothetical protein